MTKTHKNKILNHYSAWQYVVLAVTLTIMLLSALPTVYGEDAAIQIAAKAELKLTPLQLHHTLNEAGIDVKRIDTDASKTMVVLADHSQQTQAKVLLGEFVTEPSALTLALAPAAPNWLLSLGFNPIKLGLDLRGGVQFLLDVETDPVFKLQQDSFIDALRQFNRQQGIRGVSMRQHHDIDEDNNAHKDNYAHKDNDADEHFITVIAAPGDQHQIRQFVATNYPNWLISSNAQGNLIASIKPEEQLNIRDLTVAQNLQIMRSRIEQLGITEALVQRQGQQRIRIELPGVQDPAAAKSVIGATASLAFYQVKAPSSTNSKVLLDQAGNRVYVAKQPVLGGEHIIDARANLGEMGLPEVLIELDRSGGSKMSDFSRDNVGKPMATAYSEYSRDPQGRVKQTTEIISVATIRSQLGSRFSISGAGDYDEAQQLALLLRSGSMTAPVTIVEERTIGPSLGAENISNGFSALALGMAITLMFMGLWYRRLGWVANVALLANMVMLFGLLALLPGAVLTLPGIAGLVLTVGMAVDTNVLIFERIKDHLKAGHNFAQAIDRGFDSAFSTIVDANFTTMITALVLYSIGNGPIQGFALTLGLGLVTSLFTGIFASRALINWAYGRNTSRNLKV